MGAARRRRALIGVAAALALGSGLVAWKIVTQPLLGAAPRAPRAAEGAGPDPARLEADVRRLVSGFGPRDAAHPENLDRVARFLEGELVAAGGAVREQVFEVSGRTYRNVIAAFGPDSPELVVVGAHYDTAGPLPGADDNASGVAGLLELARLLGASRPASRVELVAFTLEEPPHFATPNMGSVKHARALSARGARVRAMLSLEMIGFFSDEPNSQRYPTALLRPFYPDRGNFIGIVGRLGEGALVRRVKAAMRGASSLPVHSMNGPTSLEGVDFSDHRSYWAEGYPALMVTDTAFFRNLRYHTSKDTPETLDYEKMAEVVRGVLAAVLELAGDARSAP